MHIRTHTQTYYDKQVMSDFCLKGLPMPDKYSSAYSPIERLYNINLPAVETIDFWAIGILFYRLCTGVQVRYLPVQ